MLKVSVLYENKDGGKFDWSYYLDTHIPLLKEKLGSACKRVEVDQGLTGAQPGSKPAFVAAAHLVFDSVDAFQTAFGPHANEIIADIPNYTDIQPILQLNEVKL